MDLKRILVLISAPKPYYNIVVSISFPLSQDNPYITLYSIGKYLGPYSISLHPLKDGLGTWSESLPVKQPTDPYVS